MRFTSLTLTRKTALYRTAIYIMQYLHGGNCEHKNEKFITFVLTACWTAHCELTNCAVYYPHKSYHIIIRPEDQSVSQSGVVLRAVNNLTNLPRAPSAESWAH